MAEAEALLALLAVEEEALLDGAAAFLVEADLLAAVALLAVAAGFLGAGCARGVSVEALR